ncbi:MAG: InlB B-repeat-containing protein [Paludibacteraceae bacterium]|nr:InlB B-repeat-containing protein [Paludibacteraceae bacterium]
MKTLLNLKGLCRSSQLAVNPDSQPTVNRRSRLMSIICLFLLTLGVGQMWADNFTLKGNYLYFDNNNIKYNDGKTMDYWIKEGCAAYFNVWGGTSSGGIMCSEAKASYLSGSTYRCALPNGTYEHIQLVRGKSDCTESWNYTYELNGANLAGGKNYFGCSDGNYYYAYAAYNAVIYWDNAVAGWNDAKKQLLIGRDNKSFAYDLTQITNTKIFYYTFGLWTNYTQYAFIGVSSSWGEENTTPSTRKGSATHRTNVRGEGLEGHHLYAYISGTTNDQDLPKTDLAAYADLNKTITIKQKYNSTGTGTYAEVTEGTTHGTISATGFAFDSWTTCNATPSASITKETATFSANAAFGRTSTVTLTAGETKAGKAFVGWYRSNGTLISTNPETTIVVGSADETVYAYYKDEETHDVKVYYKRGATEIASYTTESAVGVSTTRSVTAPTINDHTFSSWSLGTGITSANAGVNPISINSVHDAAESNCTLTANYTLKNCSISVVSASNASGDGTQYLMSYSDAEHAYYYDMASSPASLYFRFVHADGGKWAGDWNGSAPSVHVVDANGSKVNCNTDVSGWDNKATLNFSGSTGSAIRIWFDFNNKKTWITETTYTVNITSENANKGIVSPASVTAGKNTVSDSFTATAKTGYKFKQWVATTATLQSGSTTNPNTVKTTAAGSVQAQFQERWVLRGSKNDNSGNGGMPGWESTTDFFTGIAADGNTGTISCSLEAKTQYKFKVRDLQDNHYYSTSANWTASNNANLSQSDNGDAILFTTTAAGSYTFTFNFDTKNLAIEYPESYTVVFGSDGHGVVTASATSAGGAFISGSHVAANDPITFSQTPNTGYNFKGWYTTVDGNTVVATMGPEDNELNSLSANATVYAQYTPKTTTLSFNIDGGSEMGNETATYDAAMPTISKPTKDGYVFVGIYDSNEWASATQYYDENAASVRSWNKEDASKTLYVRWAQEFTVTIAANKDAAALPGDEYNPASHTETANTTLPIAVSAPVIPGYTFANWTLGANMTKTSGELNDDPIYITATAASTLTANYEYTNYTVTYPDAATAHCVYGDGKSTSLDYKSQGTFTVTPAAGYTIDVSANVSLSQNGNTYTFTQGTTAVEITITSTELTNTITVINGNVSSVTAKVATGDPATVMAAAAPEGKKFDHWAIDDAITLTSGTTINNRTISFHASRDTRISAVYVDRETKTVHFAKPFGWSTVTAIFSNNGSDPSSKKTAVGEPMTYEGATYYTFSYFVDDNGEGGEGDKTAQAAWNQVVFSEDGSHAIDAISFTDGNYYAKGVTEGRATPFAEWYLRGNLNGTANWNNNDYYLYPFEVDGTTATYAYGATTGTEQYFRLYRTSTGQWFRTTSQTENKEITPSEFGNTITMAQNGDNADFISTGTSETKGVYLFELTNINSATPSLKVTHPEDTKSDVSITAGANGSLGDGVGGITQLGRYMPTAISATANAGYRFKEWVTTGGAVVGEPTNASTTATATADGTITATFTNEGIVYLDLSAISGVNGWNENHPYVYFYSSSYWNDTWGSGSMNILSGGHAMTRIGATNIWYYDYTSDPGVTRTTNVIAFTDKQKNGQNYFYQCNAIYRSDFYPELNMFVPQEYRTNELNNSAYYNRGYWMKYNEAEAGYRLRIYDGQANKLQQVIPFVDTDYHDGDRNEYTATLHVDGSATARFELIAYDQGTVNGHEYSGTYYGNNGTINSSLTGSGWNYEAGGGKQTTINLNSSGDYVFTLNCHTDGQLWVKVTYPLAVGDFRVKYNGLRTTTDGSKSDVYSDEIPRLTEDGTRTDKVSFFVVNADGGNAPSLSLEKVSNIDAPTGAVTWAAPESGVTFSAKEGTNIASLASGVYVFEITQTKSGANYTLTYENKGAYEGNYYIRTDYADGGWVSYKQDANKLNRTTNENAGYTDYFCRFVNAGKNVKFCIANDYNSTLTEVKTSDGLNADAYGNLTVGANTRFEYNIQTNAVGRSYIGASNVNTFLYIVNASSSSKIFQTNGTALTAETRKFADQENWIYMLDVQVTPGAEYQLRADINSNLQYFDGTATKKTLIGGTGANQNMRLVYDFKNNHLIKAWMPGAAVSGSIAINADVMLIRENQEGATQLSFADASSELTSVQKVYGVLGFTKSVLTDGTKSSQQRSLYWISFPFDVKLKDIFGFGKYGEDYIIRRYNGEKRARIGWFAETSTFWETMDPDSEIEAENTMKAYEGYMVALDKGLFSSSDSRWIADGKAISEIYLYFPSNVNIGTLKQETTTITLPAMIYPYDRYFTKGGRDLNHRETDSNWRVIGVGSLKNSGLTATDLNGTSTGFDFYSWEASDNSLAPVANAQTGGEHATTFNAGHAVMVQWAGKITWTNASVPSSVAARRMPENKSYSVELDLNYDGKMADRTYVIMKEDASADFVLNEDLYKVTNANKPNIYAYAGNYDCGISRVPVESQTVPVGVITRKNGTYTFSMPTNFDGTVTLIDKFAQTRTNLALEDYEVALPKGTINDRFELELDIRKVPTAIDGVTDGNGSLKDGKAHKFIENGAMYILREGQIYDARGNKVK